MWILSEYMKSNKPRKSLLSFALQHQCASIPFNPFSFLCIYLLQGRLTFILDCTTCLGMWTTCRSFAWSEKEVQKIMLKGESSILPKDCSYLNSTAKRIHPILQCSFRRARSSTPTRPSPCPVIYNTCCWLVRISLCHFILFVFLCLQSCIWAEYVQLHN